MTTRSMAPRLGRSSHFQAQRARGSGEWPWAGGSKREGGCPTAIRSSWLVTVAEGHAYTRRDRAASRRGGAGGAAGSHWSRRSGYAAGSPWRFHGIYCGARCGAICRSQASAISPHLELLATMPESPGCDDRGARGHSADSRFCCLDACPSESKLSFGQSIEPTAPSAPRRGYLKREGRSSRPAGRAMLDNVVKGSRLPSACFTLSSLAIHG